MNVTELCVNCKQNNSCTMCWKTSNKKCPHFIQKTNADRIRAMSDEELSGLIRVIYMSEECTLCKLECETCFFKEVCDGIYFGKEIEWLKQPAE